MSHHRDDSQPGRISIVTESQPKEQPIEQPTTKVDLPVQKKIELPEENVHVQLDKPVWEPAGWAQKRQKALSTSRSGWDRRFIKLSDRRLLYFKKSEDIHPKGAIDMTRVVEVKQSRDPKVIILKKKKFPYIIFM